MQRDQVSLAARHHQMLQRCKRRLTLVPCDPGDAENASAGKSQSPRIDIQRAQLVHTAEVRHGKTPDAHGWNSYVN